MIAGARRSLNGADKCGDAFLWWTEEALLTICLVDGLGHGAPAASAADAALAEAGAWTSLDPAGIIGKADRVLKQTRGAAMTVVQVDPVRRTLCHAGVGNVRAALFGRTVGRFEGTPGIVGTGYRTSHPQTISWLDGDMLLLWTDGFRSGLGLDQQSLRLRGDPQALADRLIADFSTGRDDAGVVCCLLEGTVA